MTRVSKNIAKELTYINRIKALEKKVAKLEENEEQLKAFIEECIDYEEQDSNPQAVYGLNQVKRYIENNQNK